MSDSSKEAFAKSNTDRPYKPPDQKSRAEPLPRGQVAPSGPSLGAGGQGQGSNSPKNPNSDSGSPRFGPTRPDKPKPTNPAPDFKSAADKQRLAEHRKKSPTKEQGKDISR